MKFFFWRKNKGKTLAQRYKGIEAYCRKHPFVARCSCNRCIICIEEETGIAVGSVTYAAEPNAGLLMCNQCLNENADEEIAEFYAMSSEKYWHKPVSKAEVLATLIKKPSHSAIRRYWEDGKFITETTDLDSGSVSKNWSER